MKKIILSFAVVTALSLLLFSACKKGKESLSAENKKELNTRGQRSGEGNGDQADAGPLQSFFNKYGPQYQTFSIVGKQGGTIRLKGGTSITIPANAFTVNGRVAEGPLKVEVLELNDRGDIALRGINTLSQDGILVSDGSFDFKASLEDGRPVDQKLAQGKALEFAVPDRQDAGKTKLFDGGAVAVQDPDGNAAEQFGWKDARVPGQEEEIKAVNDTFKFKFTTTGWINCDRTWIGGGPGTTIITVDLINNPGTLSQYHGWGISGNTFVLLVPQADHALVQIYTPLGPNTVQSYAGYIPVGITARVFAFSVITDPVTGAESYYYASQDIVTSGPTQLVNLTFAPTSGSVLAGKIAALSTF